jgi:hypothetical protein
MISLNFRKGVDVPIPRFDKVLEEFYSICDQIELHLVRNNNYSKLQICVIKLCNFRKLPLNVLVRLKVVIDIYIYLLLLTEVKIWE